MTEWIFWAGTVGYSVPPLERLDAAVAVGAGCFAVSQLDVEWALANAVTAADLDEAAAAYGRSVPRFDVVHLGLGPDGHTASWPPDQPRARTAAGPVVLTDEFNGHRRMTLTAGPVARAHAVVWVVCGADKRDALRRALAGDLALPATHALDARSIVFADAAAA